MCGIAGYIGESKRPKVTYELMTTLFDYLELRGTDASGIWGVEGSKKSRIIYHKEPIKSSKFIKTDIWKKVQRLKPNLLLCHARATSPGIGHARHNSNNHPFVSSDKRIGLIHNGRVSEFDFLKKKYEIKSDTDSEVLLRMFEEGIDYNYPEEWIKGIDADICHRLHGIREIWSVINKGAMAVAFGERIDEHKRYLWLFHNEKRPLWFADTRETLGQIFFFSAPEIWYRGLAAVDHLKNLFLGSDDLIEVPVGQVFQFEIDEKHKHVEKWRRFNIKIGKTTNWEAGEKKIPIQELPQEVKVITGMNDDDELPVKEKAVTTPYKYQQHQQRQTSYDYLPSQQGGCHHPRLPGPVHHNSVTNAACGIDPDDYDDDPFQMAAFSGEEHEEVCSQIETLATNISTAVSNALQEGNLGLGEYQQIISSLEDTERDLKGTLALSGGGGLC